MSINKSIKQDRIIELHFNDKELIRISTDISKRYVYSDKLQHYLIYPDKNANPAIPCDFCLREDGSITQTSMSDEMGLERKTSVVSKVSTLEYKSNNTNKTQSNSNNVLPWQLKPPLTPRPPWLKDLEREL